MVKSFKHFRMQFGSSSNKASSSENSQKNVYKHSVYMQSKDSTWLNRNLADNLDEPYEPIEEDIRD